MPDSSVLASTLILRVGVLARGPRTILVLYINLFRQTDRLARAEMCSERDSPLEPFVLPAPGQPERARLICGAPLGPPVLSRKQKRPRVNSLVCDRAAAFCTAGPPEVLSRMSRPVTQAA